MTFENPEIKTVEKSKLSVGGSGDFHSVRQQLRLEEEQRHFLEVQVWLEVVLNRKFEGDWLEEARDGQVLCELINTISPGMIKRIHNSKFAFKCLENIQHFILSARKLGIDESLVFDPQDLYEMRNRRNVIFAVYDLAKRATKSGFKIKFRELNAHSSDIDQSLADLRKSMESSALGDVEVAQAEFSLDESLLAVPEDVVEKETVSSLTVTLNIDLEDEDSVRMVGDHAKLGNWNIEKGLELKQGSLGQWTVTWENPPLDISFKFFKITEDGSDWESAGIRRLVMDEEEAKEGVEYIATWRDEADDHVVRLILEDGTKVLFCPIYDKYCGADGWEEEDAEADGKSLIYHKGGLAALKFTDASAMDKWTGQELESVVTVDADFCWLSDEAVGALLDNMPNLTRIDVSGCEDVTDSIVDRVCTELKGLSDLCLDRCRNVSSSAVQSLSDKCEGLIKLSLAKCRKVEDASLIGLIEKLGEKLVKLSVSECKRLTDQCLLKIATCPSLSHLSLTETDFTVEALHEVVKGKKLVEFNANGTKTNEKVLELLAESSAETLEVLNVNWTSSALGAEKLQCFKVLRILDFSNVDNVKDDDLSAFASSEAASSLEEVLLTGLSAISDSTLASIIRAAKESIYAITLSGTQAGSETVKALLDCVKLQTVNLTECEAVTNEIADVCLLPSLQVLNVRKCPNVSLECLETFGEKRPGTAETTVQEVTVEVGSNADDIDEGECEALNEKYGDKLVEFSYM